MSLGGATVAAGLQTLAGRQPIFDRDLAVRGYELLFRGRETATAPDEDSGVGRLTVEKLLGSETVEPVAALAGTKRAFCRVSRRIVTGEVPVLVPPDRVVLDISPAVVGDDADLAPCRQLLSRDYTLAVDGADGSDAADRLLGLASMVTIDVADIDRQRLAELVARCRSFDVELIARGVDTPATLGWCESLGFDLFQGYLLSRTHVTSNGPPAPARLTGLRMSAKLLDAECPVTVLEDIVRSDPAMTHQLLRLAGAGAAGGMRRTVATIHQALVLVGWRRLQSWVALLLLTDGATRAEEEIATVLTRARMSELLAPAAGCLPDAGYTAGLVSALDVVLGMPLATIVEGLPLDDELRRALLSGTGPLGHLVADVTDYQLGCPERAVRSALPEDALRAALVEALTWTVAMAAAFGGDDGA